MEESESGKAPHCPRGTLPTLHKDLRPFLDAIPAVAIVLTPDGRILEFNDEAERVYGKGRQDVLGRDYYALFLPEQAREAVKANVAGVLAGQPSRGFENPVQGADGAERQFAWYANCITSDNGEPAAVIAVGLDTTDRKQAEKELLRAKRFSESAIDGMPGIFYFFDDEGHLLKWNRNFEDVTGYPPQAIREMIPTDFFVGHDKQRIADAIAEALRVGSTQIEADLVTRDARAIPHVFTALRLRVDGRDHLLGLGIDISDRKQAEQALLREKQFTDSVLASMPGLLYLLDAEGRMLRWNDNVEKVTGYSRQEIAGMTATGFFRDAEGARTVEALARTLSEGSAELEAEILTRSGREIPHYFTGLRILVDEKPHVLGVGIDISDRKRAEEAVAEKERYFRSLLYSMHEDIIVIDRDYRITDINNTCLGSTGMTRDEVIGKHCYQISHGYNTHCGQHGERCTLREVFETGEPRSCLHQHKDASGSPVHVDILMSPLKDGNGCVTHVVEAVRDVSDLFGAQEALQASEERFRAVVEQAADALFLAEQDGTIIDANRQACESLGYTREELLGMAPPDFVLDFTMDEGHAYLGALAPGEFVTFGRTHRRKDGSNFPVEVRLGAIRVGGQDLVLGLARDITDRKRAEERVKNLNRLEESLLAPGTLEDKIQRITDGVVRVFDADFARLWLIRPGDRCHAGCPHADVAEGPHACRNRERCLHLAASSGRYTHTEGGMHQRVPLGAYKIGRVAAAEEPGFVTNNVASDPRVHDHNWARTLGLVSFAGFKLSATDGTPIGVIAFFSKHATPPNEAALVETVAGIASQVIRTTKAEEERKHLTGVLELTTDLVAMATPGGRLTYVNRAGRELLGWDLDEDVTTRAIPAAHPKWAAEMVLREGIREAIREGTWSGETAVLSRDRGEVPVSQVIMAHRSASGKLQYLSTIMRDISERKRTEEEQREYVGFLENLERIDRAIRQAADLRQLLHDVLESALSIFGCDRSWLLHPCDPEAPSFSVPMQVCSPEFPAPRPPGVDIPYDPDSAAIASLLLASEGPVTLGADGDHPLASAIKEKYLTTSLMATALYPRDGDPWTLGLHQCSYDRQWSDSERSLLQEIGRRLADALSTMLVLQAVREREARLQSIFRAAPVTIGLGRDRALLQVNDRFCEMTGYTREEVLGRSSRMGYPSDEEFDRVGREAFGPALAGGTGTVETTWIRKDGQPLDILLSATPLDPSDPSKGTTFVGMDITKLKQAEQRESRTRRVTEAVAESGLRYLETGRIQSMGKIIVQHVQEITGAETAFFGERLPDGSLCLLAVSRVPEPTVPGWPLYDDAHEAIESTGGYELSRTDAPAFQALEEGEAFMANGLIGERGPHSTLGEPYPGIDTLLFVPLKVTDEVVGALGVANRPGGFSETHCEDLEAFAPTAALAISRSRSERERRSLEEQLRQSQKMEAVGQLAGGVAHDFNNLLQAIHGYTYLAMSDLPPESDSHAYIEEVMKASERAAGLTQQLLAFSRRQVIQPKAIDLNDAVSDMIRMLQRVIGEHIELNVMLGQHLGPVLADTGQIGQVLINLCVNARDAMPDGGRLTIETRSALLDAAFAESHPWASEGDFGLIAVTDTGVGMTPDVLLRVFEPFFTTKELGHGTGLGLATVYGIVKQHGGHLDVSSEPGRGSSFHVYLPVASEGIDAEEDQAPEPLTGGTETILLAEDEEVVRSMATEVLERAGYTVVAARDGDEAVTLFRQHADKMALAVLDVVMPKLSGRAACEAIRSLRPDLPVMFCSGYSFTELGGDFLERTGTRALAKPYAPSDLLKSVRDALDRGTPRG